MKKLRGKIKWDRTTMNSLPDIVYVKCGAVPVAWGFIDDNRFYVKTLSSQGLATVNLLWVNLYVFEGRNLFSRPITKLKKDFCIGD